MNALCTTPLDRARKAYSRVLQSMQDAGTQRNVAQVLGVSESTISRTKTEKLEDAISLLYHLGFKVVAQDKHCVPAEYLHALQVMAREHMRRAEVSLDWGDE